MESGKVPQPKTRIRLNNFVSHQRTISDCVSLSLKSTENKLTTTYKKSVNKIMPDITKFTYWSKVDSHALKKTKIVVTLLLSFYLWQNHSLVIRSPIDFNSLNISTFRLSKISKLQNFCFSDLSPFHSVHNSVSFSFFFFIVLLVLILIQFLLVDI